MFEEKIITLYECECDVCGHTWRTKKSIVPIQCPESQCPNPTRWNSGGTKKKYTKKSANYVEPKLYASTSKGIIKLTAEEMSANELTYEMEG